MGSGAGVGSGIGVGNGVVGTAMLLVNVRPLLGSRELTVSEPNAKVSWAFNALMKSGDVIHPQEVVCPIQIGLGTVLREHPLARAVLVSCPAAVQAAALSLVAK